MRLASTAKPSPPTSNPDACGNTALEHLTENIVIAEALVARPREYEVIRDLVLKAETAEPLDLAA
jgi:hypothetical protein